MDALVAASRHWGASLHFNKGLAGAPANVVAAARDTAINPVALDAFALAIVAANGPPAPDLSVATQEAAAVALATEELTGVVPNPGSYVSESDFFERDWQRSFWGENYRRLATAKENYDPIGLFFAHHAVGSERWSTDGFTRISAASLP